MMSNDTVESVKELVEENEQLHNQLNNDLPEEWNDGKVCGGIFCDMIEFIPEFVEGEDRKDAEFRASVLFDQIGDVSRHISHDPELNPSTRPLDEPEEVAYGDAIVQLFILAYMRDVDIVEALNIGVDRIRNREGYHQDSGIEMEGMVAHDNSDQEIYGEVGNDILVLEEFRPTDTVQVSEYECILTEIGGVTSHAATIAREKNVSCVVGVNSLTDNVDEGDFLFVNLRNGSLEVV